MVLFPMAHMHEIGTYLRNACHRWVVSYEDIISTPRVLEQVFPLFGYSREA